MVLTALKESVEVRMLLPSFTYNSLPTSWNYNAPSFHAIFSAGTGSKTPRCWLVANEVAKFGDPVLIPCNHSTLLGYITIISVCLSKKVC